MRVVVVGTSGSGKTTFASRLAAALGAPQLELDAVNWQAGWRDLNTHDPEEFVRRVERLAAGEAWVSDGNYGSVRADLWARASHLVWLDYPRSVIMRRVLARSFARAVSGDTGRRGAAGTSAAGAAFGAKGFFAAPNLGRYTFLFSR